MTVLLAFCGVAVSALCGVMILNRLRRPDYTDIEVRDARRPPAVAGREIGVVTWNIGYGALGADADLFTDGGKSLRTLSKGQIEGAAQAIADQLAQTGCDVICLQEVSEPGLLTRNIDVRGRIDHALAHYKRYYWADFKTVWLPRALRICHGMATYAAIGSDRCRVIELPDADTQMLGFIKKSYVGVLNRFPIADTDTSWVIINIHLPVFGVTPAARAAYLARLFDVATQEYEDGNLVVIGGDWNARLCPTAFPDQTDPKRLSDYADLSPDSLPKEWKICADPKAPTVRVLDREFAEGRTYTTIFDGFVVSPNVRLATVDTLDLSFAHADHQPVVARFVAGI